MVSAAGACRKVSPQIDPYVRDRWCRRGGEKDQVPLERSPPSTGLPAPLLAGGARQVQPVELIDDHGRPLQSTRDVIPHPTCKARR